MLPGKKYTPQDILLMVRRRTWFMVVPMVVGLYAALVVSSQRHEQYQSETLIQVVPQRVPDTYVHSTVTMRTEERLSALTQRLLSRTVLESMIYEMHLYPDEMRRLPMQDIVALMRKNSKVDPVPNPRGQESDSFFVRFTYPDPEIATKVTERLGGLFVDLNKQDRGDIAQETDEFLKLQLTETRRKLEEQEAKLKVFRQANAGRLPTQVDFNMQAIQTTNSAIQSLMEALSRDRERKIALEQRLSDAETSAPLRRATPVPAADPAIVTGLPLDQQLAAAREDLERKRLRLKPEHPDIARAERKIQDLERRLQAEPARTAASSSGALLAAETPEEEARRERLTEDRAELESLKRQIASKEDQEQKRRAELAQFQRNLEQVPGVESEFIALTRDYDTQQTAYKDLLTKSDQSKVAVELERRQIGEQFKILDPARVPFRPTGLPRIAVNALGGIVGFALGLVLAAVLELLDTTYSTGEDVLQVLQVPVVALVPFMASDADRSRVRRRRWMMSATAAMLSVAGVYGVWALELWKHVV